jgi:hypothetical protein
MEMLSKPSVDALQRKIVGITARPKGEFNKYDALELLESLKDTAHNLKQPHTQALSTTRLAGGKTLVQAGHVSPRFWEITMDLSPYN